MRFPGWFRRTALLTGLVVPGIVGPFAAAQETQVKVIEAAAARCSCGRWTCPVCQQRKLKATCPPGQVVPIYPTMPNAAPPQFHLDDGTLTPAPLPGSPTTPSPTTPSDSAFPGAPIMPSDQGGPTGQGNLDSLTNPNITNQLSPSDDSGVGRALEASGRSSSQSQSLAFNSGISDPAIFGDFFGPTSNANSIISQSYVFETSNFSPNGVGFDFDIPNVGATNDITATGSGPVYSLQPPSLANDVVRPTAPGWQFQQGTATDLNNGFYRLQYSFIRDVTVPSSFAQQRIKLAENTSPVPQNRFFVNYSLFQNVPLENGINVNRISPGFERLLFNPNTSFELRAPFATTLSSDILAEGGTSTGQVEFGNMFMSLKQVFWKRERAVLSTGLSMTVPTADATRIYSAGQEIYRINSQSVHVMPFVGGYYKPSAKTFVQGVMQVDLDVNGNTVKARQDFNNNELTTIGRLQDLNLLYLDSSFGYWAYRSNGRGLTGIAPMIEGHYNRSLNTADCVTDGNGTRIQLPIQEFDNINFVAATVFEFNRRSRLGIGYGAPIGNGSDRAFDGEFRATFNRYY